MPLSDDSLTDDYFSSLVLNREWRNIIASALEWFFATSEDSELAFENEDKLADFLEDLYSLEAAPSMSILSHVLAVIVGTTSTTSASFVQVATSAVAFTPSKANFRVTCHGISAFNSGTGRSFVELRFNELAGAQSAQASVANTTPREISVGAVFEAVEIGVEYELKLFLRAASGTATIATNAGLIYDIIEYD